MVTYDHISPRANSKTDPRVLLICIPKDRKPMLTEGCFNKFAQRYMTECDGTCLGDYRWKGDQ